MGSQPSAQTITNKTELPAWLEDITKSNLAKAQEISDMPYTPYGGSLTASLSPTQLQYIQQTQQTAGQYTPLYGQASAMAAGVGEYTPLNVSAGAAPANVSSTYTPSQVQSNYQSQGFTTGYTPTQVAAQTMPEGDIKAYMNPYIQEVEKGALRSARTQLQQGLNTIGDQALRSGAFGGSRQGISEGVATSEAAQKIGDLSAALRAQGYTQAQGFLSADQQRNLQAQMANQGAGLEAAKLQLAAEQAREQSGQFGSAQSLAAQLANQGAGYNAAQLQQAAALANQQAGLTSNQQALQAALANQQAGLTQQGLSLQAARSLSDIAGAGAAANALDLTQLQQAGALERGYAQSLLDEAYAKWAEANPKQQEINDLNLLLAATSATPYGSTNTQTKIGGGSSNDLMQGLGAAASIISIMGAL